MDAAAGSGEESVRGDGASDGTSDDRDSGAVVVAEGHGDDDEDVSSGAGHEDSGAEERVDSEVVMRRHAVGDATAGMLHYYYY
jgi:hypothetical protein